MCERPDQAAPAPAQHITPACPSYPAGRVGGAGDAMFAAAARAG